jgi:two-component system, cell cycle sensor histidine kinase and response regulator CckA
VAAPVPAAPEPPAAPVVPRPGVALVAEDDVAVRGIITRVLQEEGFKVLEAGNGQEALELVAKAGVDGGVRLLVTDLAMPALGGRELAESLREQGFLAPVLFISGYPDEDLGRFGLPEDDGEVLWKPFGPDALSERVRRLTGREPPAEGS